MASFFTVRMDTTRWNPPSSQSKFYQPTCILSPCPPLPLIHPISLLYFIEKFFKWMSVLTISASPPSLLYPPQPDFRWSPTQPKGISLIRVLMTYIFLQPKDNSVLISLYHTATFDTIDPLLQLEGFLYPTSKLCSCLAFVPPPWLLPLGLISLDHTSQYCRVPWLTCPTSCLYLYSPQGNFIQFMALNIYVLITPKFTLSSPDFMPILQKRKKKKKTFLVTSPLDVL